MIYGELKLMIQANFGFLVLIHFPPLNLLMDYIGQKHNEKQYCRSFVFSPCVLTFHFILCRPINFHENHVSLALPGLGLWVIVFLWDVNMHCYNPSVSLLLFSFVFICTQIENSFVKTCSKCKNVALLWVYYCQKKMFCKNFDDEIRNKVI